MKLLATFSMANLLMLAYCNNLQHRSRKHFLLFLWPWFVIAVHIFDVKRFWQKNLVRYGNCNIKMPHHKNVKLADPHLIVINRLFVQRYVFQET